MMTLLFLAQFAFGQVQPSDSGGSISNDTWVQYQWGLDNTAQKLYRDIDGTHSEIVQGKRGCDVQAAKVFAEQGFKKVPLVAVIDGGVAIEHEDLRNNIFKNTVECTEDGNIPFQPTEDKDGNGFKGDCAGWNFATEATEPNGNNQIFDFQGHGTHVAGIIAAEANNQKGISGAFPFAKILPIRVFFDDETKARSSLSSRVERAVQYAVKMKADVINLSLGWPKAQNTPTVVKSIQDAIQAGTVVIAAAGNDSNPANIAPCNIEGVICVGAISIDGTLARFSNRSNRVDVTAPGDWILSAMPTPMAIFFKGKGYDYLNGTSQAAPFVSAIAAALRALDPNISSSEIRARIFESSEVGQGTLRGKVNMHAATKLTPRAVLVPELKAIHEVLVQSDGTFSIPFKISSLWESFSDLKVKVQIMDQNFSCTDLNCLLQGNVDLSKRDHNGTIKIQLEYRDQLGVHTRNYQHEFFWMRSPQGKELRFVSDGSVQPARKTPSGRIVPVVSTISDPNFLLKNPDYASVNQVKGLNGKPAGFELRVWHQVGDQIVLQAGSLLRPKATRSLMLQANQFNNDDDVEYLWTILSSEGEGDSAKEFIEFCYLKRDLQPLLPDQPCVRFEPETFIPLDQSYLVESTLVESNDSKVLRLPVIVQSVALPDSCFNGDSLSDDYRGVASRAFRMHLAKGPQGVIFKTECLNTSKAIPLMVLPSRAGQSGGILMASKSGKNNFILTVEPKSSVIQNSALKTTPVQGLQLPITGARLLQTMGTSGWLLGGVYDGFSARVVRLNADGRAHSFGIQIPFGIETIQSLSAGFIQGEDIAVGFQTQSRVMIARNQGNDFRMLNQDAPLTRFTFIPGRVLSDSYFPVFSQANLLPSFYLDGTHISDASVSLIQSSPSAMNYPAKFRFSVPSECQSMSPSRREGSEYSWVNFVCGAGDGFVLKTVPLN